MTRAPKRTKRYLDQHERNHGGYYIKKPKSFFDEIIDYCKRKK